MGALLEVENLNVSFPTERGVIDVVQGVSFRLSPGETLAIVGESGSGKSVSALALMRLLGKARVSADTMRFAGTDLLSATEAQLRAIRGKEIAMIFQDPMTSLNPVLTVGRQLTEMFELHMGLSAGAARKEAINLLKLVGVPSPQERLNAYPHHFSGGMRQRVMIAMAVACRPKLLIADEPTTALDVTIQAQILDIIAGLQRDFGMAIIMITHDLGVVAGIADRMAVMYSGRVVEHGLTENVFADPRMPYTRGLLGSVPRFDLDDAEMIPIPGTPPDPAKRPPGCCFSPRCSVMFDRCLREQPALFVTGVDRGAACFLAAPAAAYEGVPS
ncbi:ABC transporter ATP-binding protein [Devosia sp. 919]|uniref:ABC transporter ATP-binding protein n=1 Tax=Devosia sp. 919 TaxID=2726065 RepID=UPI0015522EAD|nr:ABC transporter ATP-binding protein [Devosia sp. 919]